MAGPVCGGITAPLKKEKRPKESSVSALYFPMEDCSGRKICGRGKKIVVGRRPAEIKK